MIADELRRQADAFIDLADLLPTTAATARPRQHRSHLDR